jgi:hypothetical protein
MVKQQKKRKNHLRTGKLPKDEKTQILLMPPDDNSAESELFEDEDMDEETGGMYLHKEDIHLIYRSCFKIRMTTDFLIKSGRYRTMHGP